MDDDTPLKDAALWTWMFLSSVANGLLIYGFIVLIAMQ